MWVEISAANYATLTNKAVVKIVEREPLRLWYAHEDLQLQTATAWDGYLFDSDEAVVGTIRVRVGRPGRGSSLCRQAVEVKLAGEKTLRLSRRAVFDGRLEMTMPCGREGRRPRRNGLRHRDGQGRRQLAGHRRIARGAHAAPEIARVRRTGTQSGT